MDTPRIYVTSYKLYNDSRQFDRNCSKWFDLKEYEDLDTFMEDVYKYLNKVDEDPEPMFTDFEGFPEYFYSESKLNVDLFDFLDYANDDNYEAINEFIEWTENWDQLDFENSYQGEWNSEEDFAESIFDEIYLHNVPENIRTYIDYKKFARDLFTSDYAYVNGFVFLYI